MDEDEFIEIATQEWNALPLELTHQLQNVTLIVEDEPVDEVREEHGLMEGDMLLGLYNTESPQTLTLYRYPILDESLALEETPNEAVRIVIRETILYQVTNRLAGEEKPASPQDIGVDEDEDITEEN